MSTTVRVKDLITGNDTDLVIMSPGELSQSTKEQLDPTNLFIVGTVTSGSSPSVSIIGRTVNFVLQQGPQGPKGADGSMNFEDLTPEQKEELKGDTGATGPAGETGATGEKGDTGATGSTGPANTLSIGTVAGGASAGATITGTAPNQTLNLTLPKGDKGDKGDTGATGPGAITPFLLSLGISSAQTLVSQAFESIAFVNAAAEWDNTNKKFIIPATGTYLFVLKARVVDDDSTTSFGLGVHTAIADNSTFSWSTNVPVGRTSFSNSRIMALSEGVSVYPFVFSQEVVDLDVNGTSLEIVRVS